MFKFVERLLTSRGPIPAVVFLSEVTEGAGDSGVVGYEPTVKVGKTKKGAYILDFCWGWPGRDTIKLDRIYSELSWFHNHAKIFDFWYVKLTLLEF